MDWAATRAIGLTLLFAALVAPPSIASAACDDDHQSFWARKVQEDKDGIVRAKGAVVRMQIESTNYFLAYGRTSPDLEVALRRAEQDLNDWRKIATKDSAGYAACYGYKPIGLLGETNENDRGAPPARAVTPPPRTLPPQRPPVVPAQPVLRFHSSDTSDTLDLTAPPDYRWLRIDNAHWEGFVDFRMTCPAPSKSSSDGYVYEYDCDGAVGGGLYSGHGRVHVTLYPLKHPMSLIFDAGTFTVTDSSIDPHRTSYIRGARSVWYQL